MKKKASRRLVAAFTLAAMLVTLMPSGAAFAAPAEEAGEATAVTTVAAETPKKVITGDMTPAGPNQYVTYNLQYEEATNILTMERKLGDITGATVVTQENVNNEWSNGIIKGGTYVVEGDVTFNGPLTVDGFADIILKDRSQLNALQGIRLENGAHLEIFAQSEKSWNMGKLFANSAEKDGYGIGGDDAGYINIFGGFVKATGVNSPGLGARAIRIIGGDITAKSNHEAAIGSVDYGLGSNVRIFSGKVHATSDTGCGIGGGRGSAEGSIGIFGDEVTAQGEIGIGFYNGGDIWIKDGTVKATGTNTAIGTAGDYNTSGHCGDISIDGGEVTAIGNHQYGDAYGIGCDWKNSCGDVRISGGEVTLKNNRGIRVPDFKKVEVTGGSINDCYNYESNSHEGIQGILSVCQKGDEIPQIVTGEIGGSCISIDAGDIKCSGMSSEELSIDNSHIIYAGFISSSGSLSIENSRVYGEASIRAEYDVCIEESEVSCSSIEAHSIAIKRCTGGLNGWLVADHRVEISDKSELTTRPIHCEELEINDSKVSARGFGVGAMYPDGIDAKNVVVNDGILYADAIRGKLHINEENTTNNSRSIVYSEAVLDHSNEAKWNGLVEEGRYYETNSIGKVYGAHVTIPTDYVVFDITMFVPKEATLTIPEGVTLGIHGLLINEGTIDGKGTLASNDGGGYLSGSGTVASTIKNELKTQGEIRLMPSAESVAEGQYLTLDVKVAQVPEVLQEPYVQFYRGNTLLGRVPLEADGTAMSDAITVNKRNGWVTGETYSITAQVRGKYYPYEDYGPSELYLGQGTCKVSVVKPAEAAPAAPSKKAVTDTSVTLNTIAKSANGAKALYGMKAIDGSFIWQDVPYFDNLKPDTDYIFATKYEAAGDQAESPMSKEVIIRTAKSSKSDQPAPAAPVKKSVTASSVTLKTIADSSVGGKVQYGMKDATGVTKWQDSPVFENLKADTAYTFVAQYMATDKYNASAISAETVIRTEKKNSTDLLSPIILNSTGGQTAVTVTNPKPGQAVTVVPVPDKGYEVNQVKVTDENGNVIEVTKNANGQYVFNQPDTQVTIKVTYKKAVTPDEPQKPEEPETPQGDNWNNPFTDVPKGAWYNDAVRYVYENGLMVGLAPNNFGANVTTDRGQLVTMLWRMADEPQATNGADFSDVSNNAYYANAVAWAAENGITSGFEDGTFRPQTSLSREQMAALFMKYAEATGVDTSVRADISSYTDINPNSWSYDALSWAKAVGLLSGVSDTTMAPQATATRAQIAAVLQRYCETVAK